MAKYTEDSTIQLLAGAAEHMLKDYAKAPTLRERAKNLAKRAAGRNVPEQDVIFWPAGMLLLGLLEAGHLSACKSYLDDWIEAGMRVRHTDDALTGYVLVRLYEATHEQTYKDAADTIYQFLLDARKDKKGAIVYNAARDNAWIYADGVGQTAMFLSHYGTVFHKEEACTLAARQIKLFSQYGMDAMTGLPYHGYEAGTGMKYGVVGWGRAVGWLLLGTSQYVADCAARQEQEEGHAILAFHNELLARSLQYLHRDGTFSWLLPATEGPQDSSATGMIAYAFVKTLRAGGPEDRAEADEDRIADTAAAVLRFVNGDRVFSCSAECGDFGLYRQQYGCYPWGQGSVLAALAIS